MSIKISKDPQKNWENNNIQFPRILAELSALDILDKTIHADQGFLTIRQALACEMDVTENELNEVLDRAEAVWQSIKERTKP